ncbi:MAG: AMP-binding protein, partial [Desulfobacteraceae bacterium]|nr:AMP-binding protein [Desulfobacteraceae bacterium]
MKSLEKLLSELHKANIRLWADGDHLRYSAPKGSLTPEIRDQLRERKPELLVFLNKIRPSQDNAFTPVSREGRDMSLSFAQQRMWFLYQLDPEDRSYNLVWSLRLRGNLRISALEQSIQAVIQRHEALRTTFRVKEGEPVQVISASATVTLPIDDLCDLPEPEQKATVQRLAIEGLHEPFDLENGPLLKYRLLPTSAGERVLLIFGHHIICDSWSAGIFIRDLGAFYRAYSENKEPLDSLLPKLPIQYADFAYRQREWLKGAELEKQIGFWKRQLDGAPFLLELPADHPRPAELSGEGRLERFEIDSVQTRRLNRLSQEYGATSFMTLFAAFSTLIFRYTGQEDILIGTLIANRNRKEIEHLIGVFVNTLVLRADLSGDPEFSDLVDRVRQVTLDAYGHQDIPFEQLIEVLQPPRRLSHTPLFQVMFSMQNAPLKMELPGLTMELLDVERETAQFDLSFDMTEIDGRLTGTVEYRTDLFEASAIRRMIGHFRTLLEAIAEEPMQRISELPLLTEPERHQLLAEWNDTHSEYPADKTVVDMFEEQAKKSPENIAVVFEDIRLTYRELNDRSNQIAHFITDEYQIRPDDRVGLLLERSEWVIIGIMGILKAGGAYVPIDPGYPEERIKHMVSDSGCKAVLSETGIVKIPGLQTEVVNIHEIRHENYDNPDCP